MNKTLAIVGSHPRTREAFDFNRTDCDVWLFNEAISNKGNTWAKRADVIFQMHVPAIWQNPANRNDPKHYEWLTSQNEIVVYMQEQYEDVPMSKKFPLDGILDMIGRPKEHFLTSSVPQAMALAAYLGCYDRIEIYGVAMETNTEYGFQREGVAYWLGFLKGRGIDTYFADETFVAPLYGYEGEVAIPYERFGERIAELEPPYKELHGQYKAAEMVLYHQLDALTADGSAEAERKLFESVEIVRKLGEQLGTLDGAIQENQRYKAKADKMRETSGDFIFSRQEFESGAKTHQDSYNARAMDLNSVGTQMDMLHPSLMRAAKGSPKRKVAAEAYKKGLKAYMNVNYAASVFKGASQENFGYMAYLDKRVKAAGGSKSEEVLLESLRQVAAPAL